MSLPIFSTEWVERLAEEIRKGPSPERIESVDPNYWNWIDMRKENMNIRLALVLKGEREEEDQYAYLDFEKGELVSARLGSREERGTATFVLGGNLADWKEVMHGHRDITQNIMYRRLRLFQGNLHGFYRLIYVFVEMLRAGLRTPTTFEHLESKTA